MLQRRRRLRQRRHISYHNAVIADVRCPAGDPVARMPRPWMRPGGRYQGNDRGGDGGNDTGSCSATTLRRKRTHRTHARARACASEAVSGWLYGPAQAAAPVTSCHAALQNLAEVAFRPPLARGGATVVAAGVLQIAEVSLYELIAASVAQLLLLLRRLTPLSPRARLLLLRLLPMT